MRSEQPLPSMRSESIQRSPVPAPQTVRAGTQAVILVRIIEFALRRRAMGIDAFEQWVATRLIELETLGEAAVATRAASEVVQVDTRFPDRAAACSTLTRIGQAFSQSDPTGPPAVLSVAAALGDENCAKIDLIEMAD
jgi:hypothetical protein